MLPQTVYSDGRSFAVGASHRPGIALRTVSARAGKKNPVFLFKRLQAQMENFGMKRFRPIVAGFAPCLSGPCLELHQTLAGGGKRSSRVNLWEVGTHPPSILRPTRCSFEATGIRDCGSAGLRRRPDNLVNSQTGGPRPERTSSLRPNGDTLARRVHRSKRVSRGIGRPASSASWRPATITRAERAGFLLVAGAGASWSSVWFDRIADTTCRPPLWAPSQLRKKKAAKERWQTRGGHGTDD
jgi:hypothetical protein